MLHFRLWLNRIHSRFSSGITKEKQIITVVSKIILSDSKSRYSTDQYTLETSESTLFQREMYGVLDDIPFS